MNEKKHKVENANNQPSTFTTIVRSGKKYKLTKQQVIEFLQNAKYPEDDERELDSSPSGVASYILSNIVLDRCKYDELLEFSKDEIIEGLKCLIENFDDIYFKVDFPYVPSSFFEERSSDG